MPELDVVDVLLDGMLAGESFVVLRRLESRNQFGRIDIAETRLPAIGSIVPVGENSLVREDAYQTQTKTIRVITPFRLRGATVDEAGARYQPDVVEWKGDRYVVRTINDYSQYGATGLIEAECSSMDFLDRAQTPQ
jgi:hypothetical protein